MSAMRLFTGAAITACCVAASTGSAEAKLSGSVGSMIAYERNGDIWVTSDRSDPSATVFDRNLTASTGEQESAPSWAFPDNNCLRDLVDAEVHQDGARNIVYASRADGSDSDVMRARLVGYPPTIDAVTNLTAEGTADEGAPAVGFVFDAADEAAGPIFAVVFTRGPVGQRDIWAKFLDNSHETRLTDAPGDEFSPDWSSDGGSVVYETTDASGRRQLASIAVGYNSQGEHDSGVVVLQAPRFITSGGVDHDAPSWLGASVIPEMLPQPDPENPPHTSRIVHVVTAFGTTYLDFLEAFPATTTTGPLFAPGSIPAPLRYQLTGDPGGDLAPSWHPHGTHVVFDSDRGQAGNRDIYRIEANGTNLVRLTQDPATDRAPDWEQIGFGCLTPTPYDPRPGTQSRTDRRPAPQTPPSKPKPTTQTPLRIAGLRVTKSGTGNRRFITVRFVVNKAARGSLRAMRGRRVVARRLNQTLSAGNARIRLSVPRKVRGGSYRLRLTVSSGPTTLTFHRNVRIRSLRSRR